MQASLPSDDEDVGNAAAPSHQSSLPNHYFYPNPITSPDQLSQTLAHVGNGAYFVVTQGLDPGIYNNWCVVSITSYI